MNKDIIFQSFHWYLRTDENLWQKLLSGQQHLTGLGITHIWLPPAYKSAWGSEEPGYAVYDLYDLGEFDQKGSVRTRWGTKDEYLEVVSAYRSAGVQVLA